ncbi:tRNA pseudouridine synthase D domain containing protein protein [Babesia ovis]|uniref:tRNA pseudouridine synthase D domain containing protein protein n=1 Tax=Babesia ovis TaxID=5869 RepID=A0A9W5T7U5_BABOV|nr:tRNA pseudouridine synthase D domain containing protein protein [Babesia ovis]
MDNQSDLEDSMPPLLGKSRLLGMGTTMVELMMPNVYTERIEGFIKFIPEDFVVNEIDTSGRIVVARRTAHTQVAAMALANQRSRISGDTFLKLRKVGNLMGTMKYPSTIFTKEDTVRIDALLDELVSHMVEKENPISHKKPPFCLLVLSDSENAKELRTQAHAFIRENLPFLDSVANSVSKLRDKDHADYLSSKLSESDTGDDSKLLIKVFPRVECIRNIQAISHGPDDWLNDVLKDMPPCGMPTLDGVVKHLDLTDYDKFPTDYKERQKMKHYLHFNIQKRDRSTHDITNMLCRTLHRSSHDIFTAGNKDKRAITTQRFCIRRAKIEDFVAAMTHPKWLDSVVVADFRYSPDRLKLGDLRGNTFWVTIRGISDVQQALINLESLRFNGFLNYFGLQRFGSRHVGTHVVGAAMLRRDYESVVRLIINNEEVMDMYLAARKASSNTEANGEQDVNNGTNHDRAESNHQDHGKGKRHRRSWNNDKFNNDTLATDLIVPIVDQEMPFPDGKDTINDLAGDCDPSLNPESGSANGKDTTQLSFIERDLITGMERNKSIEDVLRRIPTNVLSIYVHAAQSLVFNHVLTERLKKYGMKPIPGDFVIRSSQLPLTTSIEGECVDCTAGSQDPTQSSQPQDLEPQAYVVTPDDVDKWSLYDVVLPLPGDNVEYPEFLKPVYERVVNEQFGMPLKMFSTLIDDLPEELKGRERCLVSVGGGYRHIVARAHGLQYHIVPELSASVPLSQSLSPYMCLRNQLKRKAASRLQPSNHSMNATSDHNADQTNYKLATRSTLVVSCALPKSCYLTCALREVLSDESLERQYVG